MQVYLLGRNTKLLKISKTYSHLHVLPYIKMSSTGLMILHFNANILSCRKLESATALKKCCESSSSSSSTHKGKLTLNFWNHLVLSSTKRLYIFGIKSIFEFQLPPLPQLKNKRRYNVTHSYKFCGPIIQKVLSDKCQIFIQINYRCTMYMYLNMCPKLSTKYNILHTFSRLSWIQLFC